MMGNTSEPDPCEGNPDCQLTVQKRTVIRTHLDLCSPCGDRYTFETELRQVVSMRCQEKVPDALRARIAAALRAELER
jgi:mycothiol system anti-sigma-R factor